MPVPCDYVCAYACAGACACACAWPVPVPMPLAMPVPLPVLVPVYVSVPVSMSVSVSSFCGKCSRVQQGLRAHRALCTTTCVDSFCVQSEFRKPAAFLYSQDACIHSCTHAHAHTYAHAQDQVCFVRELFLYHLGEILVPKRSQTFDQRHKTRSLDGPRTGQVIRLTSCDRDLLCP